eukprot:Lankesteria_metandrocarpae@DN5293_c0_g1_i1.p1
MQFPRVVNVRLYPVRARCQLFVFQLVYVRCVLLSQIENVGKGVLVQCHTPLLVATKLSKVRKPSLTVPSTYQYAHDALAALNTGHPKSPTTVVPSLAHGVMLGAINLIPKLLWASYRFKATTSIRRRYLKKLKEATD